MTGVADDMLGVYVERILDASADYDADDLIKTRDDLLALFYSEIADRLSPPGQSGVPSQT